MAVLFLPHLAFAGNIQDWARQQRVVRCFPAFFDSRKPSNATLYAGNNRISGSFQTMRKEQMTAEHVVVTYGELTKGIYVMYDPLHRIALMQRYSGSEYGTAMLIQGASKPPRPTATGDLSHFNRDLGATISAIEARLGPLRLTTRCGMQAGTYYALHDGDGPVTYVFRNGRVIAISDLIP